MRCPEWQVLTAPMNPSAEIRKLATPQELFEAAAEEIILVANDALAQRGRFTIALSGGSTPRNLYTLLATNARTALNWEKCFFFWGDERHVPPDDPDSNYRMAQESMLSKVSIPTGNVFRVPTENPDADAVALAYEQTIRKFFSLKAGEFPRFDFILLGMGPDGHTASLFPDTAALHEQTRLVVANWVEKLKASRITFTLPVLNATRCAAFMVSGMDKAPALRQVLHGDAPGEQYPAKLVQPKQGNLIWLLDRAAASELPDAA
ncbi:MAG TPA: 6-phosphogluconolactonase [Candidatus Sulfotelmatobacter sp.]